MTCKDCIHYDVCDGYRTFDVEIENKECPDFKDKFRFKEVECGKWVMGKPLVFEYHCSKCKFTSNIRYKFCPNCGADMRGKKR